MDLNDCRYFALIVEQGGFSAAERQAHITKSKLSRRVGALEEQLGVRLLQRSTRRLALTEAGQAFYEHCAAMVVEAEAARQAVEQLRSEPAGTVRVTCPQTMAELYVMRLLADFMRQYPKVRIELDATDRTVNLIEERVDLAIRRRANMGDPTLVARRLASSRVILVASRSYAEGKPPVETPEQLAAVDTIGALSEGAVQNWSLVSAQGESAHVTLRPRLLCSNFGVQHQAAMGGVGVAMLPLRIIWRGLEDGSLVRMAKEWSTPDQDLFLVYPSRRGQLPSVRVLIEYLLRYMPTALAV